MEKFRIFLKKIFCLPPLSTLEIFDIENYLLMKKIRSTALGKKYMTDVRFRAGISLYQGFFVNLMYIIISVSSDRIETNAVTRLIALVAERAGLLCPSGFHNVDNGDCDRIERAANSDAVPIKNALQQVKYSRPLVQQTKQNGTQFQTPVS